MLKDFRKEQGKQKFPVVARQSGSDSLETTDAGGEKEVFQVQNIEEVPNGHLYDVQWAYPAVCNPESLTWYQDLSTT